MLQTIETELHLETCKYLRDLGRYFVTTDWRGENLPTLKAAALNRKSFGGAGEPDFLIPYTPMFTTPVKNLPFINVDQKTFNNGLVIEFKSSLSNVFNKDGTIKFSKAKNEKDKVKSWHNLIQFAWLGYLQGQGFYTTYVTKQVPYSLLDYWFGQGGGVTDRCLETLYTPVDFFGVDGCSFSFVELVKQSGEWAYFSDYEKLPRIDWAYYK